MVVCTLQGRMENNLMKKIIDGIVYDTEVSKKLGMVVCTLQGR